MTNRQKVSVVGCALLLAFAVGKARAGQKQDQNVVISDASAVAFGMLGTARNSADTVQDIGCYTYGYVLYGVAGYCWATNTQGTYRTCWLSTSNTWGVAATLQSDSELTFWWQANGNCLQVQVDVGSMSPPKAP